MTTPTLECPKCGRRVPEGAECAVCGVVFAKLQNPAPSTRLALIPTGAYQASPRRSPVLPLLGLLAVVALGALAASGWIADDEPIVSEPGEPQAAVLSRLSASPKPASQPQNRPLPASSRQAAQARLAALPPLERPVEAAAANRQPAPPEPKPRWVVPDSTWFEGANGFDRGLTRARDKNQAVLVYFYADWCGYCRQLERDLLNRAVVQEYTKYLVKIRVNPESGAAERALATTYGVAGYPSVFVHPAGLGTPKKVRSMTKQNGSWRSLSTQDYVENLTAAAGERFGTS